MPRVSALIVSYNTRDLLLEAVASVADSPDVEVIVHDNASEDGSADAVAARYPYVQVLRSNANLGFAAGVNHAAACSRGQTLLVLNPDARLDPGALDLLVDFLDGHQNVALVSPALHYADGRPQAAAFRFPGLAQILVDVFVIDRLLDSRWNGRIWSSRGPVEIDHPLGACMLIRRAAWDDVGSFDEGYFMYVEEVDWCRRARLRGWQIWQEPRAVAVHHVAQSTRQHADAMRSQLWRSRLRYYQRYSGPLYNRLVHVLARLAR